LTNPTDVEAVPARIAVAIPCYNEAPAIAIVIERFSAALPGAELVVFDNNSTDGTGQIARDLSVRVIDVPEQGKGHAVRTAFKVLNEFDIVILTDGDGTYPAEGAPLLVAQVLDHGVDMAVGARQPEPGAGAMTLTRGFGNLLIRSAFRILIGPGNTDLLSGYRAFSRRYRETVRLRSAGFEIETELASEAVARKLRVVEIAIPYHPRIAGTQSKLRAFHDGWRILTTIIIQSMRLRPHRLLMVLLAPAVSLMMLIHWSVAAGFLCISGLLIAHLFYRSR
jgi:glycosyltransferase involved in cell wall biosynthesis